LSHRLSSYAVYIALSGATAFFFTVFGTLSSVYRLQTAGLRPFQLVHEVPSGVVADVASRRRSVSIRMFANPKCHAEVFVANLLPRALDAKVKIL
jgi:hypothetical protein